MNNELWFNKNPAAGGYAIQRSLRFNSSDSAYLSRTPASAGNRKTWTWAGWVKRSALSNGYTSSHLFGVGATSGSPAQLAIYFETDRLFLETYYGSGTNYFYLKTSRVFRDLSAWYHIAVAWDTTQATAADRIQFYVNGVKESVFSTSSYPTLNFDGALNDAVAHNIGRWTNGFYTNGYLADIHFIDGQALDPTSFGEFSATTGVWVPKAFTGSYGTNGFKLNFADNSSNTATTLGKDTSGNGNNWTPNNLSVTAGAGNDSLVDVPVNGAQTDTGAGGEVRGNYATLNPLNTIYTNKTLSDGNLQTSGSTSNQVGGHSTIQLPNSGKWYAEMVMTASAGGSPFVGVATGSSSVGLVGASYRSDGTKELSTGSSAYGSSWTTNDVIGVAFDSDNNNGQITFYKNGVSQGVAYTGLNTTFPSGLYFSCQNNATGTTTFVWNFGQRPFAYTAPSGFKALNTANLPAPVVTKPSDVFDVALWTGNGSSPRTISGLNFSPDLVWIKNRTNSGAWNVLFDVIRGGGQLSSNQTDAELAAGSNIAGYVSAYTSDGFTLSAGSSSIGTVNENGSGIVAWTWDAGSSTVTNTSGSISSQVRANASAGFSVVSFTTPASGNYTFGHGLNVAPSLVILKSRGASSFWLVYHSSVCDTVYKYLRLHTTNGVTTDPGVVWGAALPTSTVVGVNAGNSIPTSQTAIAYCFAPVAGYSAFGSYTGNGSADGPFVYLGFRPAFVLVKMSSSTGNWTMLDTKRLGYNVDNNPLFPNLANAEGTTDLIDITSNGFKVRTTDATFNTNAGTYVYAAWAESPFQYSRAR